MGRKDCDIGVILGPIVKVWAPGQSICFIGCSVDVHKLEISQLVEKHIVQFIG